MSAVVVVGAQWGDEGKGKVIDLYTEAADMVVRYAGGPNAGHTLVVGDKKVIVRLVPSGILRPHTTCVLGQGMVIDPASLVSEMDELAARGHVVASAESRNLLVSDRAHMILPYHVLVDGLREQLRSSALGTTKRGVGPCYEDKAARRGIPLGALRDKTRFVELVARALEGWAPHIRALGGDVPDVGSVMAVVKPHIDRIVPLLRDTSRIVEQAVREKKRVLFEGAQGTLLDVDHGTYPFVTSSSATAGGACTGTGVGPTRIDQVIGLVKAYCTRVGSGPFPTELDNDSAGIGDWLRKAGNEFGSVTGRPRRTGWLDLPALKYAARINGLDGIALTKLDVLTGLDEIRVCTAYKDASGQLLEPDEFPVADLDRVEPVYTAFPGWKEDISKAQSLDELPKAAIDYIRFVEESCDCPIVLVSVGFRRDETIKLKDPFASGR